MNSEYKQYVRDCLHSYEENYPVHQNCGGEVSRDRRGKHIACEKCGSTQLAGNVVYPTSLSEASGSIVSDLVAEVDKLRSVVAAKNEEIKRLGLSRGPLKKSDYREQRRGAQDRRHSGSGTRSRRKLNLPSSECRGRTAWRRRMTLPVFDPNKKREGFFATGDLDHVQKELNHIVYQQARSISGTAPR